jgi:hypothetical protein
MKFYRNDRIEQLAEERLVDLERELGCPVKPPIPIDHLAEQVFGLSFLWDSIEELPGEIILGAIVPKERLIILNDRRQQLFKAKPGLERSTKGHEIGHWDLFVDKATLDHPVLFDTGDGPFRLRSSPAGDAAVLKVLYETSQGQELLREIHARGDEPDEARAVNRYAAALSMPRALMREEASQIDRTHWRNLYRLAERFNVTITALTIRLKQLGLLYITDDGQLFESQDAVTGQRQLF